MYMRISACPYACTLTCVHMRERMEPLRMASTRHIDSAQLGNLSAGVPLLSLQASSWIGQNMIFERTMTCSIYTPYPIGFRMVAGLEALVLRASLTKEACWPSLTGAAAPSFGTAGTLRSLQALSRADAPDTSNGKSVLSWLCYCIKHLPN